MSMAQIAPAEGLALTLEISGPVIIGLSTIAIVRLLNNGGAPVATSARLNLMEGDLWLYLQGPDGERHITGWQADTAQRRVTLAPGEEIANGLNLLGTDAGPVFPVPGNYSLVALFACAPQYAPLRSQPITVVARLPISAQERELAHILQNRDVRDALLLARPSDTQAMLTQLAVRFAGTTDAMLAELLVDAPEEARDRVAPDRANNAIDSEALMVAMLQTPFSNAGSQIANRFVTGLEARLNAGDAAATPDTCAIAERIARRQPYARR